MSVLDTDARVDQLLEQLTDPYLSREQQDRIEQKIETLRSHQQ